LQEYNNMDIVNSGAYDVKNYKHTMFEQKLRKYFKLTKYYLLYYSKHMGLKYLF
jgi:hypothetical protein